ncbi:MAG: DMT family transporter [Myxococcales bacterium]|nr:DMT family transporter [Myxococcales bacterium]
MNDRATSGEAATASTARVVMVLTAGVLAIASSAPIIRAITERTGLRGPAGSVAIAAARMVLASLLVAPTLVAARRRGERAPRPAPTLFAGAALALHFATWISSLSFTSMAASTVIVTTAPVWTALHASFVKRRWPPRATVFGLALALTGACVLALGDALSTSASAARTGASALFGDLLALVGAWSATAYYLASQRARSDGATLGVTAPAVYAVSAVVLAPIALATGSVAPLVQRSAAPWVLALAVIPQLVGHTAFHWAMKYRSATSVTTVILLEPVGAAIIGAVAFGERPSATTLAGAALLLIGVWRTSSADEGTVSA